MFEILRNPKYEVEELLAYAQSSQRDGPIDQVLHYFQTGELPETIAPNSIPQLYVRPRLLHWSGNFYAIDYIRRGESYLIPGLKQVQVVFRAASAGEEVPPWKEFERDQKLAPTNTGILYWGFTNGLSIRENLREFYYDMTSFKKN